MVGHQLKALIPDIFQQINSEGRVSADSFGDGEAFRLEAGADGFQRRFGAYGFCCEWLIRNLDACDHGRRMPRRLPDSEESSSAEARRDRFDPYVSPVAGRVDEPGNLLHEERFIGLGHHGGLGLTAQPKNQ